MSLRLRIDRLHARRAAVMQALDSLTSAQLAARPKAGQWSVGEIVEHLALAERDVLRGLPDPAQLRDHKRTWRNRLAYLIVVVVLKARIRVKVPSRAMVPKGNLPAADLRRMWDESGAWLTAYVAGLDGAGMRKAVFRHPVAGPITLPQVLHLSQIHIETHLRQIRRIITSAS